MLTPHTLALLRERYGQGEGMTQPITPQVPPETEYTPPAPAQSPVVVTQLEEGGVLVSYIFEGRRYACTGANEKDARDLLTADPAFCLVR